MATHAFLHKGEVVTVKSSLEGEKLLVEAGSSRKSLEARFESDEVLLRDPASGRVVRAFVVEREGPRGKELLVAIDGRVLVLPRAAAEGKARTHAAHDTALEAPMPGTCRDVFVKPGDKVEKGARLILIEAMKMEHELRAPRAGVVKAVRTKKGEAVSPGAALVELE